MINPECFQLPWLQAQATRLQVRDIRLLERCIHALELVARLRRAGLDFVFKGGTSLVLHLQPLRRLSIDVDIACGASLAEIKRALADVVYQSSAFKDYEHQVSRDRSEPPTKHFLVKFDSVVPPASESHILLDVLFEESVYPELVEKELVVDFVQTDAPVSIRMPTVDCLLGDKLAAFAPGTIGVLYDPPPNRAGEPGEPQHTRVVKQLYDVSELFTVARNLDNIRRTYENIRVAQNRYRGRDYSIAETLGDSIDAAYWFSQRDLRGCETHDKSDFMNKGIRALDSHLIGKGLSTFAAKAAAARAACLAAMLLGNARESLDDIRAGAPHASAATLAKGVFTGRYERLSHLSKTAREAYYYWQVACGYLAR